MRALLWRRQASSTPGATVVIAVIVLVAAVLLTAWPKLMERTFTDEVQHQIDTAGPTQRTVAGQIPQPDQLDPFEPQVIDQTLTDITGEAGPHLSRALGDPRFSVTSENEFEVEAPGGRPIEFAASSLRLRLDLDIGDYVEITDGSWPEPLDPDVGRQDWHSEDSEPVDMMLSTATAEGLGLVVGDEVEVPVLGLHMSVRLSGLYEPLDPDDDQWQHQLSTETPLILRDPQAGDSVHAIGYLHPDDHLWLSMIGPAQVQVWIPVAPDSPDARGLLADLRTITATEHVLPNEWQEQRFPLDSSLVPILQGSVDRWQGTSTVLMMLAAGPLGVLVAVLALATRLAISRRRDTLALATARGGSATQVRAALGLEGLALGLPAAALGAAAATLVVPGPLAVGHYAGAGATALAPALFLATSPLPNLRTIRTDLRGRSRSPLRWVAEVLVLGTAASAVYLVAERGLVTAGGPDPLSIATPLLMSLAAAILAVRLLPLPLTAVHRILRRRRPLAAFLGSARAIREGHAPLVPVLALLVGISIAVFSTVMISTLRTGAETAGLSDAGADVRVTGPALPPETLQQIEAMPGVDQVVPVTTMMNVPLAEGSRSERITLIATDVEALAQVQQQVPEAIEVPAGMATLDGDGHLPMLLSSDHHVDGDQVRLVMSPSVESTVVGRPLRAPGLTSASSWALVDLELLREQTGSALMPRLALMSLVDGGDPQEVITSVEQLTDQVGVVTSPAVNVEELRDSPAAASLEHGFGAALVITVMLSMVSIVLTLVMAAPARGRLVAVLRTLGAGAGTARAMVTWETLPLVAISVVFGTALGLLLPQVLAGAVDLRPFTGGAGQPDVVYQPLLITGVVGAVAVVLTICVLAATAFAQRLSLSVLRIGDPT